MNLLTKAVWTGFACVFAVTTVQAQVPAGKILAPALKTMKPYPKIIRPLTPEKITRLASASVAPAPVISTGWYYNRRRPGNTLPNLKISKEHLNRAFLKKQAEKQKKDRLVFVANILIHKDALLRGYHLPEEYLEGFFMKRIFPYQSAPHYTADEDSDQFLFRGMLLTPEELIQILNKGFSPKTSAWNAGTDGRAAVSLSSSITEASHYIFQSGSKKNGIGVVFEIRRTPGMQLGTHPLLNKTKTIYYSYENIDPEAIANVYIWGEYGLENLKNVLNNAKTGHIRPHQRWTGQFGRMLF